MKELEPLSPELRRELADAQWPEPSPELPERLLGALRPAWTAHAASLAAGAAAGTAGVAPAVGALRRLFGSFGLWATSAALVTGGVSGALVYRRFAPPVIQQVVVQAAPEPVRVDPPARVTPPAPVAPPEPAPEPVKQQRPPRRVALEKPAEAAAPPPPVEVASTLEAEQRLLEAARTAYLRREPALALPLLEEYGQRFAQGALREEHAALEIQVLSMLGRCEEANAAAARFAEQFPRSVFKASVAQAAACTPK